MGVVGQRCVDRFTRERDPVPIAQEVGWTLVLLRTGRGKIKYLAPTGVRTPNRLDSSESPYRLQTFQKTISVLIAEYERSFSGMNLRNSPQRAAFQNDHVSTSLFARLLRPPLFKFKRDEKEQT